MIDDDVKNAVARAAAEYDDTIKNGILLESGIRINDPEVIAEFEKACSREEWIYNASELYLDQKEHPEKYDSNGYLIEPESSIDECHDEQESSQEQEMHEDQEEIMHEKFSSWRTTAPQKIGFLVGVIMWFITPLIVAFIYSLMWLFVWLNHDWEDEESYSNNNYCEDDYEPQDNREFSHKPQSRFNKIKSTYNFLNLRKISIKKQKTKIWNTPKSRKAIKTPWGKNPIGKGFMNLTGRTRSTTVVGGPKRGMNGGGYAGIRYTTTRNQWNGNVSRSKTVSVGRNIRRTTTIGPNGTTVKTRNTGPKFHKFPKPPKH